MTGDCQPNFQSPGYHFLALLNKVSVSITMKYVIISFWMHGQVPCRRISWIFPYRHMDLSPELGTFLWKLFSIYWLHLKKMLKFYDLFFPLFKNRNSDLIYKTSFECWEKERTKNKTSNFSVWFFKTACLKLFPPRHDYSFIFAEGLNLPVFVVLMSDQFALRLPLSHIS